MDENETDQNAETTEPTALPTADELAAMTPEEVADAQAAATEEATALRELARDNPGDMSDAQIDRLEALADFQELVTADSTRRQEEAAEREARVQAAAERLDAGGDGDDGEPGEGDEDGDGDEGDDAGDGDEGDAGDGAESVAAAAAPVRTPARTPSRIRQVAQRRTQDPRPAAETPGTLSIVASAEVPGYTAGQELGNMAGLAAAFVARSKAFPQGRVGRFAPLNVATIERRFDQTPDGLYQSNPDFADDQAVLTAAANERRLPGGSLAKSVAIREKARAEGTLDTLVAAGGWCAPSTTMYGLCQSETLDGIIEVSEVGVDRGGLNFTEGPDFVDIYTGAGFAQTEAEAIAGETKDCVEITCPDFDEVRLDAVGICVRAPLLTRAAYPELIERWVEGTVVANQHKVGARVVTAISTLLGASDSFTLTGTPLTWGLTTALELVIEGERQKRRLSESETWEAILPHWAPVAVRADLANRNGIDERSVTRAQVMEHFTDRGVAPQFVYGLQDLPANPVAFPSTITALVYPAGTFVKGTEDVISLDTVYDNPSLQTNMYTAAFVEDGVLVAKMCPGGKKVTIPCNVNGMLAAAQLDDNWGGAQAESAGA